MDLKQALHLATTAKRRLTFIKSACVGAVILVALTVCLVSYAVAATVQFPDVPASNPYHNAIVDLAGKGIVGGYTNGAFGPADKVVRQQFAKMLVLAGGYPVSESDVCPFADVVVSGPGSFYPDNYVAVAAANHLTVGKTDTSFDPYANITRYQVVTMVVRMVDNLRPDLLQMPPSDFSATGSWGNDPLHGPNAMVAQYNGLLVGLDLANLDPYGDMTRGEAAQVLYNALIKLATVTTTSTVYGSTSTAGLSTTAASSTTTTLVTTTTSGAPVTSSSTTTSTLPTTTYGVAGLEDVSVVFTVRDQFGNVMPRQQVFLTSTALEGNLTHLMTSFSLGLSDENGNVAWSWGQEKGDWGVEQVVASSGSATAGTAIVQWVLDDRSTHHVSAVAGETKVTVAAGYSLWNGDHLKVCLNPEGLSIGGGTYVSASGAVLSTNLHTWVASEVFFVGATSTNTDGEPNWMYNTAN